jgi:3',5'-cyclic AMP phosphodiesterase CpdA
MTTATVVQLSDPHIGADWGHGDPAAALAAAVDAVRALELDVDAVLVSGDLAEHGSDAEYERVRELLAPLGAPLHVLAGNHDDRAALRRHFGLPGSGDEPVQYAADLGPLRLVVLDSTVPGEDRGELDGGRLAWLDAELGAAAGTPTVVALHHPPLVTGMAPMDRFALAADSRAALAEVVGRHAHVCRVVAGHVHRAVAGELAGRAVLAAPSTYVQARLDFRSQALEFAAEPRAFAVHALLDGALVSHIQPVA